MNYAELDPPNFRGGPQMCKRHYLPAFESEAALRSYYDTLPAITVDFVFTCVNSQSYHATTHMRPPSAATSGSSTREQTGRGKR